jgi:uncharacterized protein (TIGR02246 family)
MKKTGILLAAAAVLSVLAGRIMMGDDKPAAPAERPDDTAAVRKAIEGFAGAFQKGDANAAAAFLTSGAELIPDEGPPLRGRDAIQQALAAHFAKNKNVKYSLEFEATRFPSRDSAIQEGTLSAHAERGESSSKRFSIMCLREDGKWLLAFIKEWPDEDEDLKDLDWLIGTWSAKRGEQEVRTKYEWFGNKSFIKAEFTIQGKEKAVSGIQMIGLDPTTGDMRTWIFEANGGFGEGTVEREGNKWIFESSTNMTDGSVLEAKNILVQVNKDTFTWQPINLTVDGVQYGNLPPVKITRVKSKD